MEGSHLGRGRGYYDEEERRQYEITTLSVTAWHVAETDYKPLPDTWTGQFHAEDTYVVRWKYKVALTGRTLAIMGGGASKHSAVGRDRCAYFFWQGSDSKVALQGASALHTVELDSERGPQLRVKEGREHAAFLSLWQGHMMVMKGRRGETGSRGPRLFVVRGYDDHEKYVSEVRCEVSSLRSRGVFLVLAGRRLTVWSGQHAGEEQIRFGADIAGQWRSSLPVELGQGSVSCVETVSEGGESADFWDTLLGSSVEYQRLTSADIKMTSSPRLFHMTSVLGAFEVTEVRPDTRKMETVNNLLFDQFLLYDVEQPGENKVYHLSLIYKSR